MDTTALVERLTQHRLLGSAPHAELEWLAAHGEMFISPPGAVLVPKETVVQGLFIVLSGHVAIEVIRAGGRRRVMEWSAGEVTGVLPYSRLVMSPGESVVLEPTESLLVNREHFPEMIRECPHVTATLVHVMVDRARVFTSADLQVEKMVSLGKLAAGLAHELNNPASAAARGASLLGAALGELEMASRALGESGLTAAQVGALNDAREQCLSAPMTSIRSPLEQADRQDAFETWLAAHGADDALGAPLADSAATIEVLDHLATVLPRAELTVAMRWLAAASATRALATDIEKASKRIHQLVMQVKGFTHMDRAPVIEIVDIRGGMSDTLGVLAAKARGKSVAVTLHLDPNLPSVRGVGGELNQVWANLIDNALDAVGESGHVDVSASRESGYVVVRVVDDGPGVPDDVRGRIFDPFVTTKPVGHGTGMGLDIARRVVRQHEGDIDFESRPGRTEFRVRLPVPVAGATTPQALPSVG
jgi:signal transduction histidine kinase